jgi:hypothetical protein
MTIKDLKEKIQDLPDDMIVRLLDLSTDDPYDCSYGLTKESCGTGSYYSTSAEEHQGEVFWISFTNKLYPT